MKTTNVIPVGLQGPGNTTEIGGSRFALWGEDVINPVGWGQQWTSKPYTFPTGVPMFGTDNAGFASGGSGSNDDGSNTLAIANPLSPVHSPLPFALVAIVVAVVGLHWLHWREERHSEAA